MRIKPWIAVGGAQRLGTHLSKRGNKSYVVDQHHSADFSRASERQPPPIRQHELDASVIGPLSRLIVVAEVTAHAEMQNQSATVIESDD